MQSWCTKVEFILSEHIDEKYTVLIYNEAAGVEEADESVDEGSETFDTVSGLSESNIQGWLSISESWILSFGLILRHDLQVKIK